MPCVPVLSPEAGYGEGCFRRRWKPSFAAGNSAGLGTWTGSIWRSWQTVCRHPERREHCTSIAYVSRVAHMSSIISLPAGMSKCGGGSIQVRIFDSEGRALNVEELLDIGVLR